MITNIQRETMMAARLQSGRYTAHREHLHGIPMGVGILISTKIHTSDTLLGVGLPGHMRSVRGRPPGPRIRSGEPIRNRGQPAAFPLPPVHLSVVKVIKMPISPFSEDQDLSAMRPNPARVPSNLTKCQRLFPNLDTILTRIGVSCS